MSSRCVSVLALGVALPLVCGCAKDDTEASGPFAKVSDVQVWAAASALGVYVNGYKPIAVADGKDTYEDATCPVLNDDGTTLTVTGDCLDDEGHSWKGQVTVVRDGDDRSLTFDNFEGMVGTFTLTATKAGHHEFEAHLVNGGTTTIDYSGGVDGDYVGPTTWSGSGHIQRRGGPSPNGAVDAVTIDEVLDGSICAGQPASGSTTLDAGNDTAVITYDGESDCDSRQKAQLSVNGKDRGLIPGIVCAVRAPGAPGGSSPAAAALVLAVVGLGLRRRS